MKFPSNTLLQLTESVGLAGTSADHAVQPNPTFSGPVVD